MNKPNIMFIVDADKLTDFYNMSLMGLSIDEQMLELTIRGYNIIDLTKKNYVNSSEFKIGNFILIPTELFSKEIYYTVWQILNIDSKGNALLFARQIIEYRKYHDENSNEPRAKSLDVLYKNSTIRSFLNSDKYLERFPKCIQERISFHKIYTNKYTTKDRFWLPSLQDVLIKQDPHDKTTYYDFIELNNKRANVDYTKSAPKLHSFKFQSILDRTNTFIRCSATHSNYLSYWLRTASSFKARYGLDAAGIIYVDGQYSTNCVHKRAGVSPMFILDNI